MGNAMKCEYCRRALGPDEPSYRVRSCNTFHWPRGVGTAGHVCEACAKTPRFSDAYAGHHWYSPRPCLQCQRPVIEDNRRKLLKLSLCSGECRVKYNNTLQNRWRVSRRQSRPCPHCGETFQPVRADSVYCSAACKQAAYRSRVRADIDFR
jgi:protein-arginine kinase activator protein McsA